MKKYLFVLLLLVSLLFLSYYLKIEPKHGLNTQNERHKTAQSSQTALFVPYWSLNANTISASRFNSLIYFGLTADRAGVNKKDQGYRGIAEFIKDAPSGKEKVLALSLLNTPLNFSILSDKNLQAGIIKETIDTAKKNSFDSILLDMEVSSIPFGSLVENMNSFEQNFYRKAKSNNLDFYVTISADVFYRVKAYDVKFLSQNADKVFIMAYDFHKANGDPGPNFPLAGEAIYGYDFRTMVNDFLDIVPKDEINIVFGMFGYDWTVDSSSHASNQARPLSFLQIDEKFLHGCFFADCSVQRDRTSAEEEILYKDTRGQDHVVWFEDTKSVEQKKAYLKTKGIKNIGFWAYSYF